MNRQEVIRKLLEIRNRNLGIDCHMVDALGCAVTLLYQDEDRQLPEWMGPGPHYVVATEEGGDTDIYTWNQFGQPVLKHPWLKPSSPIIHEHQISATSLKSAMERAAMFRHRFGKAAIFRLVIVEEI